MVLSTWFVLLLSAPLVWGQFPAVCNTPDHLAAKECCPDSCGSRRGRGNCVDISDTVVRSWNAAQRGIVEILRDGPKDRN